jgi:hypothetical protein
MMNANRFEEFDQLIADRAKRGEYYALHYSELESEANQRIANTLYGKHSLFLGPYCPSLVYDKTIGGFKRGKPRKNLLRPENGYVSYEVDVNGKLLRMKDVNKYGTVSETYVIREGNEEYSIPFSDKGFDRTGYSVRAIYEDNRIMRCDLIYGSHLWSEIYDYKNIALNLIRCTQWYYVPGLKGSDKSKKPGEPGSPARQWEMNIYVDADQTIIRLEYGELINGKVEISYIYEAGAPKKRR